MHVSSVQLRGKEQVLTAYDNIAKPHWALWQGGSLLYSYKGGDLDEGRQLLDQWIDLLQNNESASPYALCWYDEIDGKRITNKTPYDNRLQFKLYEQAGEYSTPTSKLHERIRLLEERLNGEEEGEGEKVGGIQGAIVGMIKRPEVQEFLLKQVVAAAGRIGSMIFGNNRPASVAGVPTDTLNENDMTTEQQPISMQEAYARLSNDERQKLDQAMEILVPGDNQVGTNLLKLANILKTNPGKYQLLASMA